MRTAITVAIDSKGKAKIVHGPEVPFSEQYKHFRGAKQPALLGDLLFFHSPKVIKGPAEKPA